MGGKAFGDLGANAPEVDRRGLDAEGAGYVKFAVYTWTKEETDKLLEWCDRINEEFTGEKRVTLMIMGEYALISRRIAIHKEFPFVYSAPDADTTTAPGQPTFQELLT